MKGFVYGSLIGRHGLEFSNYVIFGKAPIVLRIRSCFRNSILAVEDLGFNSASCPSYKHYDLVRVLV